jgi:hypothetical protein
MTCHCIRDINKMLEPHDAKIEVAVNLSNPQSEPVLPVLSLCKISNLKKKSPVFFAPSFCPFCGRKYKVAA